MGERQLEQLGTAELDAVVPAELDDDACFLLAPGGCGAPRLGRSTGRREQRREPAPEREAVSPRGRRLRAARTTASAAAAPAAYVTAFMARVTLCPPNPNEFERAAFTRSARA